MSKIKVVTDSAGDIPVDMVRDLGITIVPLTIRFGSTEYRDVLDLSVEDFWQKAATSADLPQTAAPSSESFKDAFEAAREEGYTGAICICISSKLSATYQSALKAAESYQGSDFAVAVVDSQLATYGEGALSVLAACNSEMELDALVALVKDTASRTRIFGALDTLENLRKGGRIGAAAATLGSILSVKPIIEVVNGAVEAPSKQRTRRRALEFLYELVREAAPRIESIAVIDALAPDLDEFLANIKQFSRTDEVLVTRIGPVIGAHAGPRTIGVCIISAE